MEWRLPELRDYQEKGLTLLRQAYSEGHKKIMLFAATGSGKGVWFLHLVANPLKKNLKVCLVMRRRQLVLQSARRFQSCGINPSIFMGTEKGFNPNNNFQICSIDTIARREIDFLKDFDVIICDECFKGNVEILTNKGFIKFEDLKDEKVAQVDSSNMELSFVKPIRKIKKYYNGTMISFYSSKKINITMTENHDFLTSTTDGNAIKIKAKDVQLNYNRNIFFSGYSTAKNNNLSPVEKLSIAYQADGSEHYKRIDGSGMIIGFSFSKSRKIAEFLKLMEVGSFDYKEIKGKKAFGKTKMRRRFSVNINFYINKLISKQIDIEGLSLNKSIEIIEYMNIWDGHVSTKNSYIYTTTIKDNADFYQAVSCLCGYKTKIKKVIDNRSENFSDVYRLFINKKQKTSTQGVKAKTENYEGNVYCVTVPMGNIVVRSNGHTLITGNCHDCVSPTYQKFLSNFNDKIIIGLTATPFKIGNKNHSYWDACIKPVEAHELMKLGYLAPCSLFIPSDIDLSQIETDSKTRDYKTKQLSNAMSKREIVGDIVENYKKLGNNKQAICFCVDKQHSKILCQEFNESGIKAMHADESTKQKERDDILNKFKRGEIQVITNVMIFSTGLDLPQAEVGIMARPTKSEVLWIQQVGRLLRPYRKCGKCNTQYDNSEKCPKCGHDKPNYIKDSAIIIDHGANSIELGHPYDVRYPDMGKDKEKQKREKSLLRTCKQCFFVYPAQIKTCPNCNNVNKLPERLYETKQGEIVPYDEFSLIKNYYDGLLKSERIMAWRRNAKYFKLYEKFGSKVMKYKKEFSIPPWIPKIIEKQKKEELQGKLYDGSET